MVSVCVPFYVVDKEGVEMTLNCAEGFEENLRDGDELVLVDDASPFDHKIESLRNKVNLGNAGAWNVCVGESEGDIILLSDNDITPFAWRAPMLKALEKYDVVFPVVYNESIAREERHLAGECFMFKRSLYEKIGPFDEGYGSYFEDTDWFKRVQVVGGTLGIAEGSHVSHKSQGTFSKIWGPEKRAEVFNKNKSRYESKFGTEYPYLNT